jgi:hypothetical protein
MFIAMCAVTVITFDLAFIFERYLRHTGKLHRNTSVWQKVYSACSIIAAVAGAAGLILLSIFDNVNHNKLHTIFLAVFIIGYIVSAIFICWEYQRLGIHYREHSILAYSFWIKLAFIIIEICLCIVFGVAQKTHRSNLAAIFEWIIAFVYTFYVLSFFIDFLPAIRTKHHQSHQTEMQMAEEGGPRMMGDSEAESQQYFRGQPAAVPHVDEHSRYTNGHSNGYTNGHNGYANGHTNGYTNDHADGYTNGYTNGNGYPKPQ